MSIGDIAVTVVVLAVGVISVVLAVQSIPAWWTTKFEFPPPTLTTLALVSSALIAFFVTGCRLLVYLPPAAPPYVESISYGTVEVWEGNVSARRTLRRLGGRRNFITPWIWTFKAPDDPSLARLLTALRDAGVGFRGGDPRDWTPSDYFMILRENGLVSGSFDEVGAAGVPRKR